jgi:hypothetical protein
VRCGGVVCYKVFDNWIDIQEMNGWQDVLLGCLSLTAFIFAVVFYTKSQQEVFKESDDWTNKYRQPLQVAPKNWYTKLFKLKYKERFPLSGSLLVALTDRYHRWQFFFKVLLCVAIVTYQPLCGLADIAIYFALFGLTFTVVFRR